MKSLRHVANFSSSRGCVPSITCTTTVRCACNVHFLLLRLDGLLQEFSTHTARPLHPSDECSALLQEETESRRSDRWKYRCVPQRMRSDVRHGQPGLGTVRGRCYQTFNIIDAGQDEQFSFSAFSAFNVSVAGLGLTNPFQPG